jgi:hypothetical protein
MVAESLSVLLEREANIERSAANRGGEIHLIAITNSTDGMNNDHCK